MPAASAREPGNVGKHKQTNLRQHPADADIAIAGQARIAQDIEENKSAVKLDADMAAEAAGVDEAAAKRA